MSEEITSDTPVRIKNILDLYKQLVELEDMRRDLEKRPRAMLKGIS